jgi:hypothetical protein
VARTFGEQLLHGGAARLFAITRRDELGAWEIFVRYRDKAFSYTDCTSFGLRTLRAKMRLAGERIAT